MRNYLIKLIKEAVSGTRVEFDCPQCVTLKESLEYERARNKTLDDAILELIKPKPIPITINRPVPDQLRNTNTIKTHSRQRMEAERADRQAAERLKNSNLAAKETRSESIDRLEQELQLKGSEHGEQPSNSNS